MKPNSVLLSAMLRDFFRLISPVGPHLYYYSSWLSLKATNTLDYA